MSTPRKLRLLEGHGLEIETMLVDPVTLDVLPVADRVLAHEGGEWVGSVDDGDMGWSNELVLHVIEVKNERPVASLAGLEGAFDASYRRLHGAARAVGATLLPGAAHPWMDPAAETRLWPHEYAGIYAAYDRIFDCRRHGWANLQSTHLNLSFGDDREFVALHAAVRLVLPLIPALAAASPVLDGRVTGLLDSRVQVYGSNSAAVPAMAGRVIPEPTRGRDDYRETVLVPLWRDLAALDTDGLLQEEFANARGAIPRFERDAIEVRLIDAQECPRADVAICALVTAAVALLLEQRHLDLATQMAWPTDPLVALLAASAAQGPAARLDDARLARAFGAPPRATAGEVWRAVLDAAPALTPAHRATLGLILDQGTLAQRILARLPGQPTRADLRATWRRLQACHERGLLLGEAGT